MSNPGNGTTTNLTIGQVVGKLSTEFPSVTHSSLRFLERQGLIEPARTPGGHRLYPPEQVERIFRIKEWQRERLSLEEIRCKLQMADRLPDFERIAQQLLEHLVAGDRRAARNLVIQVEESGAQLGAIFDEIFRPVLQTIGARWAIGSISIGQEKEISAVMRELIAMLSPRHEASHSPDKGTIVAACVEGENHELGLWMITALLRQQGRVVHYLGASVSPEFLVERVVTRHPAAVLLAAMRNERLPDLERTLSALAASAEISTMPTIIVGGAGVPSDWQPDALKNTVVVAQPDLRRVVAQIDETLQTERNPTSG